MATGGSDSEENVTKYCTSCELEDKHVVAFGYCLMCDEFLCIPCYECHRKPLITRNHVLLKEDEMPIKDITKENKHVNVLCQFHEKPIDYYCQKCNFVGCNNCMSIDHKICLGVTFIPQYVEGKHIGRQRYISMCDDTIKSTKNLATTVKRFKHVVESNTEKVKQQVKDEMAIALGKFIVSVNRKIDKISLEDKTHLDTIAEKCKYYQDWLEIFKNAIKTSNDLDLFVYDTQALECKRQFKELMTQNLEDNMKIRRLHFKTNLTITSDKYGELVEMSTVSKPVTMENEIVSNSPFKPFCGYNIHEFIILQNGNLMFTDTTEKTVSVCSKVDNMSQGDNQEVLFKFDDPPWDLVEFYQGPKVAVTVPKSHKVVFLIILCCSENNTEPVQMLVDGEFETNGECTSIAWLGKEFVVSFGDPAKVEIISLDGDVLQTVRDMKDDTWGFRNPISVACDVKQQLIYVADFENNTVVLADHNGNVKAVLENTFNSPMSLAVDKNGAVLVAVKWFYSLQMISPDFFDQQTLLDRKKVHGIKCIAYAASDHSVYVYCMDCIPRITKWKFVD